MSSGAEVDFAEVVKELQKVERRAADLSEITPVVAEILVGFVNDEWESAGRGRWPGFADSTLKKRRGTSAQLLKDTGRAAASVFGDSGPDYAEAATDVAYMAFHASDGPRTKIPLRNPFDVLDVAMPEVEMKVARYIALGEAA